MLLSDLQIIGATMSAAISTSAQGKVGLAKAATGLAKIIPGIGAIEVCIR